MREVARARVPPDDQLEAILAPYAMTEPGIAGKQEAGEPETGEPGSGEPGSGEPAVPSG